MKVINNKGALHSQSYHMRTYKFAFEFDTLLQFDNRQAVNPTKSYKLSEIRSCTIIDEQEVQERVKSRERSRSKSLLKRMTTSKEKLCPWNFGFDLEFVELTLELYSPTRDERLRWIKLFETIAEMNKKMISTRDQNPFKYMKEQ